MSTVIQWTPNEGILRKLERLAYALVRTRPLPRYQNSQQFRRNPWAEKCRGLGGPFALGVLVAIPYVAQNSVGSTMIASLLVAAMDACLADLESKHGHCNSDLVTCVFTSVGEFPAFLIGWWRIQGFCAGFAAACRSLSSIIDSVTGKHVQTLIEDQFGTFLPLGARLDVLAVLVAAVPTLMCAFGMEESGFLRCCLFLLTASTVLTLFSSSFVTQESNRTLSNFGTLPVPVPLSASDPYQCLSSDALEETQYTKILTGAAIVSIGFFGLYKTCCPDGPSTQYEHRHRNTRHFRLNKRFSLIGCLLCSLAFFFHFLEGNVLSKTPHNSRICRDHPLLWPVDGGWRIGIASLGVAGLSLATLEYLIPLCSTVTKMANDGLLYRDFFKKDANDLEEGKWTLLTPLLFGALGAFQSLLLDTKALLSLLSCSLMSIHIVVSASMLTTRYQVRVTPSPHQRVHESKHRTRSRRASRSTEVTVPHQPQTRRLMTVSFLKSGISRIPIEVKKLDKLELDGARVAGASRRDSNSDRTYLMDDVAIAPFEPRDSIGSAVSGYESESEAETEPENDFQGQGDTDIDAAVLEYQEGLRVAALSSGPVHPTPATARRVCYSTFFLVLGCIALAAAFKRSPKMDLTGTMLAVSSGLLAFLLLHVISRQPQKKRQVSNSCQISEGHKPEQIRSGLLSSGLSDFFNYSIIPWAPAAAIFSHACLLVVAIEMSGFLFAIWLATGLIIYFSYGVSKSIAAPSLAGLEEICSGSSSASQPRQPSNSPASSSLSQSESVSF